MPKTKPVRPEYLAIAGRIRSLMDAKGLDQSAVARRLGIEPQSVQQWISGQTMPRGYRIKALAVLLGTAPWELLGGPDEARFNVSAGTLDAASNTRKVPRIAWVSAGAFRDIESPCDAAIIEDWDIPTELMSSRAYTLRVEGDSMEPEFPDGCIIFVEPDAQAANGDYVVVKLDDKDQATFKQLVVDGPRRYLKPVNPRYPVIPVERDASICGVVREMRKLYPKRRA
ncbi:MAG TPA: LexA family transcriptional regulator [Steroidobacteraceae bacterium]|nr:LexA family transcriptional regulator [Steroidobacteraceae bacterium]